MILSIPRKHLRALQACVSADPLRPQLHGVIIDLTEPAQPVMVATDGVAMIISHAVVAVHEFSPPGPTQKAKLIFRPLPFTRRQKADDDIRIDITAGTATDGKTVAKIE